MPPKKSDPKKSLTTKTRTEDSKQLQKTQSRKRKAPSSGDKNDQPTKIRKRGQPPSKQSKKSSSKSTIGSNHDPSRPPAPQASATRLPADGQSVTWKAMPGWIQGTVLEILKEDKEVEGKMVKATGEDPRVVLKSSAKSGKICVHKPQAIYFE